MGSRTTATLAAAMESWSTGTSFLLGVTVGM
jgi:hypothetical protein